MAYTLQNPAPSKGDPTAKNRVWDFFGESSKSRPKKRPQSQQPHRKNRPCSYKTASGIPYWQSRDPIGEEGGMNLHGFLGNNSLSRVDLLGLLTIDYDVFDVVGGGYINENTGERISEEFDPNRVTMLATLSLEVDVTECNPKKCEKTGDYSSITEIGECTGNASISISVSFKGLREHMDNTWGNGKGNPHPLAEAADLEARPMAGETISSGSYSRPTPMNWHGELDNKGRRKGKGGITTVIFEGNSLPCSGGTLSGEIVLTNGISGQQASFGNAPWKLRGLEMYRVKWSVVVKSCGNVTEEKISLEASGSHPAAIPRSSIQQPRPRQ